MDILGYMYYAFLQSIFALYEENNGKKVVKKVIFCV